VKKSKSPSKRTSADEARGKTAKPLRDLKVAKSADTRVRGGLITEIYDTGDALYAK
jgi:hypothetical protein